MLHPRVPLSSFRSENFLFRTKGFFFDRSLTKGMCSLLVLFCNETSADLIRQAEKDQERRGKEKEVADKNIVVSREKEEDGGQDKSAKSDDG